jgi:hypothetical protein
MKTIPTLMNSNEGKQIVAKNIMLMNEAKMVEYNAMREILKENGGKTPANLDLLINDRAGARLQELGEQFAKGMSDANDTYAPRVPMVDEEGNEYDIPYNEISQAQKKKLRIK